MLRIRNLRRCLRLLPQPHLPSSPPKRLHSPKLGFLLPDFFHSLLCLCESPNNTLLSCGAQTWLGQERPMSASVKAQGERRSVKDLGGGKSHSSAPDFPQHLWPRRRTRKREVKGPDELPAQVGLWKCEYLDGYSVFTKD